MSSLISEWKFIVLNFWPKNPASASFLKIEVHWNFIAGTRLQSIYASLQLPHYCGHYASPGLVRFFSDGYVALPTCFGMTGLGLHHCHRLRLPPTRHRRILTCQIVERLKQKSPNVLRPTMGTWDLKWWMFLVIFNDFKFVWKHWITWNPLTHAILVGSIWKESVGKVTNPYHLGISPSVLIGGGDHAWRYATGRWRVGHRWWLNKKEKLDGMKFQGRIILIYDIYLMLIMEDHWCWMPMLLKQHALPILTCQAGNWMSAAEAV